jgi:hypothetical protein
MKKSFLSILACLAMIAVSSCNKNDDILYSISTMGNVVNGQFVCDGGDIYNIVKTDCAIKLDTMTRFLGYFDVMNKTEGKDDQYDVKLTGYAQPLLKDPILKSTAIDSEIGNDPINLCQGWLSGGYMNMLFGLTLKAGSETSHLINLEMDDTKSNRDTLYFNLKHNGYGEVYGSSTTATSQILYTEGYASFPISRYLPSGQTRIYVTITWYWYLNDGNAITSKEVEKHSDTALMTYAEN